MRFSIFTTVSLLSMLNGAMASWLVEGYVTGCPAPGEDGYSIGGAAGEAGDDTWCAGVASAHNVVATGIEADGMVVTLFSDPGCENAIIDFDTDGCKVIPKNTVIEAARIVSK
ncbi:hypothetical protein F5Y12DRAFT_714265 [Xylaria sp. FL1777]|nr:hypothetical protein F5Y12DRAFT_714265 [Xylaria sp. FL1777]